MVERVLTIAMVLFVGWYLGYQHHRAVSAEEFKGFEEQVASLEKATDELRETARFVRKVSVKTTAYSNDRYSINVPAWRDGITATGAVARKGLAASDWGVFPPGTRIYVPGYGEAVVQDKGGKVRGYHLDLFMDTRREAIEWGVKKLDVYVIDIGEESVTGITG
jgi:3D (Asp-Asp-Asp) domain-containing protein